MLTTTSNKKRKVRLNIASAATASTTAAVSFIRFIACSTYQRLDEFFVRHKIIMDMTEYKRGKAKFDIKKYPTKMLLAG